jgi:hypothetical protein
MQVGSWIGGPVANMVASLVVALRLSVGAKSESHFADLKGLISRGAVVVVTGAGFSRLVSGDPVTTWQGFLSYALARCRFLNLKIPEAWFTAAEERIATGAAKTMAEVYGEIEAKLSRGELERLYDDALGHLAIKDPAAAHALAALRCPIITTNFDNVIERITKLEAVTWRSPGRVQDVLCGLTKGVVHVHGIFNDVGTLIMTPDGYASLFNNQQCQALLHGIKSIKALLFVGCGATLSDPNFSSLFAWSRANLPDAHLRVYRLARTGELAALRQEHADEDRVVVLPYGDSYEDLAPFLRSLAPPTKVLWQLVACVLALMLAVQGWRYEHPQKFLVSGVVLFGDRPAGETTVAIPGYGPERVTDPNGYFSYECSPGKSIQAFEVRVGGEPFHFPLDHPVTRPSFIELHLETKTSNIGPPR